MFVQVFTLYTISELVEIKLCYRNRFFFIPSISVRGLQLNSLFSEFHVLGADHIPEERGERAADDVRETGEVGLHFPKLRLHQQGACPDAVRQREAAEGRGPRAVLRAVHLQ